MLRAMVRNNTS